MHFRYGHILYFRSTAGGHHMWGALIRLRIYAIVTGINSVTYSYSDHTCTLHMYPHATWTLPSVFRWTSPVTCHSWLSDLWLEFIQITFRIFGFRNIRISNNMRILCTNWILWFVTNEKRLKMQEWISRHQTSGLENAKQASMNSQKSY